MTLVGRDTSHYDGNINDYSIYDFFTAKVGEGLQDTEGTIDDSRLYAAFQSGVPFLGGYFIPRTVDSQAQIDEWWMLLTKGEPWWTEHPGWFNQIDLERWPYDNVAASKGIELAQRWRDKTGRQTILYASRGQYGDTLSSWDGPLWNADYRMAPDYAGDGWLSYGGAPAGWAPYSGKVPAILQYTSTPFDLNAFRGSREDFRTMINGGNMAGMLDIAVNADTLAWRIEAIANMRDVYGGGAEMGEPVPFVVAIKAIQAKLASGIGLSDADRITIGNFAVATSALVAHLK